MLPLRLSKIRTFLMCLMCLMLAGTIMLHKSGGSLERYLGVIEGNQNGKRWKNEDRIAFMIKKISQFDPATVVFPNDIKLTPTTKYATKRQLIRLPLAEMDPNPQAKVNRSVGGDTLHFLHGCAATSGVQIDTSSTHWIMASLDLEGNLKTYGGDEFYITYNFDRVANTDQSPDAVARVVDRGDGTYELFFLQSRSPRHTTVTEMVAAGYLTINLVYTCAVSFLNPPEKTFWPDDGSINAIWNSESVPPPDFGRFKIEPRRFPELSTDYDYVYAAGDSLMRQFVGTPSVVSRDNIVYDKNTAAPLNTHTVYTKFLPMIQKGEKEKEAKGFVGITQEDHSAFIIGSCVWDIVSLFDKESFDRYKPNGDRPVLKRFGFYELNDHLEAIRTYIISVQKLYPQRDIYWKGCTAMHRHALKGIDVPNIDTMFYVSLVRGRHLDTAQKELMGELNVPVIDMFEMTYEMAELHFTDDTLHYNNEMIKYLLDYFIPENEGEKTKLS